MSVENCLCDSCLEHGCEVVTKAEHVLKMEEDAMTINDLRNKVEELEDLIGTLKRVVDYLLENQ